MRNLYQKKKRKRAKSRSPEKTLPKDKRARVLKKKKSPITRRKKKRS